MNGFSWFVLGLLLFNMGIMIGTLWFWIDLVLVVILLFALLETS